MVDSVPTTAPPCPKQCVPGEHYNDDRYKKYYSALLYNIYKLIFFPSSDLTADISSSRLECPLWHDSHNLQCGIIYATKISHARLAQSLKWKLYWFNFILVHLFGCLCGTALTALCRHRPLVLTHTHPFQHTHTVSNPLLVCKGHLPCQSKGPLWMSPA